MFRVVASTALIAFLICSSSMDASAAKRQGHFCETSKDCPRGFRCKHTHPKKIGVCVATPISKKK